MQIQNLKEGFLEKYNRPGPRYTSYPPATAFTEAFDNAQYLQAVKASNEEEPQNLSFYFHVPFCPQRCFFCGCNTASYQNEETVSRYINCLIKEFKTVAQHIDSKREITQIHWGGGTPNSIDLKHIARVMETVLAAFTLAENHEIAIECNPAYLEPEHIKQLAEMGFNRISLGIQDFHQEVLDAINRKSSLHPLEEIIQAIKDNGFKGFNFDLIYGLPLQTRESFQENLQNALSLNPDRIVTFSYAHVPWFNENQKKLEVYNLPSADIKMSMLLDAIDTFTSAGYDAIGMDHFAKPDDELSQAKQNLGLHRNFQGYCTKATTGQVYAFGSSSISQMQSTYSQNTKNYMQYIEQIEADGLAIARGYSMSFEEKVIREVINEIMCNGHLDFAQIATNKTTTADAIKHIVDYKPEKLQEFLEDDLITITENGISVSPTGMLVVRNIAMAFDPALSSTEGKFSKTV